MKKTRDEIIVMATKGLEISLIKALREEKSIELKDARDLIRGCSSSHIMGDGVTSYGRDYDIDMILNLFGHVTFHEKTKELNKSIQFAINNYEILGFSNIYDAIQMVVKNIKAKEIFCGNISA